MKLHIFDSTGDTVIEVTDKTLEEAERIAGAAWANGKAIFTGDGERIRDALHFREAAKKAVDAYVVPQLRGG